MRYLEHLIEVYESNEEMSIDEILSVVLKDAELSIEESIELKRQFFAYIEEAEAADRHDEYEEWKREKVDIIPDNPPLDKGPSQRKKRLHKKYVEAFINNISVPKSLKELSAFFMDGNDAQKLIRETMNFGKTSWSAPRWAKRGDIVLFMHAKTANSTLTRLRTEVRTLLNPNSSEAKKFEHVIADQLTFHKEYGGKIYAVGRINGRPEYDDLGPLHHAHSKTFCDIDNLFLLDTPIDIAEFNSYIKINRMGGITPVYGRPYEQLKERISEKNEVPGYFLNSFSTPFPHNRVNRENWIQLGLEYRNSFTLEIQFRQCYVDYLLQELGDQKTIYMECQCYKGSNPITFVDNVIRINKKFLPVEVRLNINLEAHLKDQCEQYCMLDKLILNRKTAREASNKALINDRVLIIDTYGIYMFYLKDRTIKPLYDLGALKSFKDIRGIRDIICNHLM